MNISQIEHRERALKTWGAELHTKVKLIEAKGIKAADKAAAINSIAPEFREWEAERDNLKRAREVNAAVADKMGYADSATKAMSPVASPLNVSTAQYKSLFEAARNRLPSYRIECDDVSIKSPFVESGFTSGGLPNTLLPGLTLDLPYEPDRAFAHFKQMPAPESIGVEYVQHTSNTNPASAVAELGTKPDLGMVLTTVSQKYQKIAALASVSSEAIWDFSAFMSFVPQELQRAVIDAETNEVINGSGSSPHLLGLLNTSGVLTRAMSSDTPLDAIRKAINDIRVGTSFAAANLILMHPTTLSDLTLQKATTGAYLLNPDDPNAIGDIRSIFGLKVVTNTAIAAGTAVVLDSNFVYAWTRRGLTIDMNSTGSDGSTNYWTQNAVSFRCEERIAIGVARPTTVNIVTGLPSS
jgi:hypothetical protein